MGAKFSRYSFSLLLFLFAFGCKKKADVIETKDNFDRKGMLTNFGNQIIVPGYTKLLEEVDMLQANISEFILNPDSLKLDRIRQNWKLALMKWQKVSMFEFGPAEDFALQANLNIYPTNTEQITQNIITGTYDLEQVVNLDAKGFQALDYLLYGQGDSTLVSFTTDSLAINRKKYLKDLVDDIQVKIKGVTEKWLLKTGNYITTFISNAGTDKGSSVSVVVNALCLDFERYFRDGKIGIPAGVRTHTQTPLPDKVEAYYEGYTSLALAMENMESFLELFVGMREDKTNGLGFDDYLDHLEVSKNGRNLSSLILNKMIEVLEALKKLNPPLKQEVVINQAGVIDVFNMMQELIVLLKVDMASNLGVTIVYTDNDGD